jgi:hypothetical protein
MGTLRRFVRLGEERGDGLVQVIAGLEPGDELLPPPLRSGSGG